MGTISSPAPGAGAPLATFVLEEPLSRTWAPQWVTFRAQLTAGAAKPATLWVTTADGSPAEHAVQVTAEHGDGSAAEVIVSVYTGLDAGERKSFVLAEDAGAARGRTTLLVAEERADAILLRSDRLEVRLPPAATLYSQPAPPANVPGPLLGLRLSGGPWLVPGRLEGTDLIQTVRTERVDAPAHRLVYRVTYHLAGGGAYRFTLELPAHEPVVFIEEDYVDSTAGALVLDLYTGLAPDTGHWRLHRPSDDKRGSGGRYSIDYEAPNILSLQPMHSWYTDQATWWGCYPQNGESYLCLFTSQTSKWTNPLVNLPRVTAGPGPALEARLPLRAGRRRWGIILCPQREVPLHEADAAPIVYRQVVNHEELPLDRVKDLVLDWPGCETIEHPRLLCRPGDVPGIRAKAATFPDFRRILEAAPQGPNDPAGLYLATGDEAEAHKARALLLDYLRDKLDNLFTFGFHAGSNVAIGHSRRLRDFCFVYDLVAHSKAMSDADRGFCRRAFAFLAYAMADKNYWPDATQGFPRGNINFHSDWYTCEIVLVGLLAGHPLQPDWMAAGETELDREFDANVFPGGAWREAPNYHQYSMHYLILALVVLKNAGCADFSRDARVRATMDFARELQTPVDLRAHHAMLPTMGDTTASFHSQSLQVNFAWMATLCRDDPDYAGRMMHAWARAGRMLVGAHNFGPGAGWTYPLCLIDPAIATVVPEPPVSRRYPGFGAVLRHRAWTDRESYLAFKMGPASHHYDNDEGQLHWYAHGVPLVLDFGSMYRPSINQPWLHSTLAFDHKALWSTGDVSRFLHFDGADFVAGRLTVQHTQSVAEMPDEEAPDEGISYGREWVFWRRQLLFVKGPDYLVLRDDVEDARDRVDTEWSLQVLAESVRAQAGRASLIGQLGMDLEVVFAQPEGATLRTGEWSYPGERPKQDWLVDWPLEPMGERQISLHARTSPGGDYLACLFPSPHDGPRPTVAALGPFVFRVVHDAGDDLIFFADRATALQADGVRFSGRVGVVRREPGKTTVWILEGDGVELADFYLTGTGSLSVEIGPGGLRGEMDGPTRTLRGKWAAYPGIPHVTADGRPIYCDYTPDGHFSFTLPEGTRRFRMDIEPDTNVWEFSPGG